jgi:hypothetical protein
MATCPNINHPDWVSIVDKYNEVLAYYVYDKAGETIPSINQADTIIRNLAASNQDIVFHEVSLADNVDFIENEINEIYNQRIRIKTDLYLFPEDKETLKLKQSLERIQTEIDDYEDKDIRLSFLLTARYNLKRIKSIKNKLENYKSFDWKQFDGKLTSKEFVKKSAEFGNFAHHALTFLNSYEEVSDLKYLRASEEATLGIEEKQQYLNKRGNTILKDNISERVKINRLIRSLHELEPDIQSAKKALETTWKNYAGVILMNMTGNKALTEADFFNYEEDAGFVQKLLDNAFDSNNPLVADMTKWARIQNSKADLDSKKLIDEFNTKTEDYLKNNSFDDIVDKSKGTFITKFRIVDYLETKKKFFEDMEAMTFNNEIEKQKHIRSFFQNNLQQKYSQEFYDLVESVPPSVRMVIEEYNEKIGKILKGITDKRVLTEEEDEQLVQLRKEKKQKVEEESQLANFNYDAYSVKLSDMFNRGKLDGFFVKTHINNLKSDIEKEEFIQTNMKLSDYFWFEFNKINDKISKGRNKSINKKINTLLAPYRDSNGIIKGHKIPKAIKEEIELLEESKHYEYDDTGEPVIRDYDDAPLKIQLAIEELNNLREVVPNKYYYEALKKEEEKLKEGETIESTQWYMDNHLPDYYNNGVLTPAPWFTTMLPVDRTLNVEANKPINKYLTFNDTYRLEREIKEKYINEEYKDDVRDIENLGSKWLNPVYNKLTLEQVQYLDYTKNLIHDLMEYQPNTMLAEGYIPAIRLNTDSLIQEFINSQGFFDSRLFEEKRVFDKTGKEIKRIPRKGISKIEPKSLVEIRDKKDTETPVEYEKAVLFEIAQDFGMKFSTLNDVLRYNKSVEKYNKTIKPNHAENISYNLKEVMNIFIEDSVKYNTAKNIEGNLLYTLSYLSTQPLLKTNYKGQKVYDEVASRIKQKDVATTIIGSEASNTYKLFEYEIDKVLYDDYYANEGRLTTYSRVLQNYVSKTGIGFNIFSALNNVTYGKIQMSIEAASGQYFNYKMYLKARADYDKNIVAFIGDTYREDGKSSNKLSAFIRLFDIFESQADAAESDKNKGLKENHLKIQKILSKTNAWYILQHMGEHMMQNQVLLSMAYSHKVIEGKIVTLNDYLESKLQLTNKNNDSATNKAIIESNKQIRKEAKKLFDDAPSVYDLFVFENGNLDNNNTVKLNEFELEKFKERVKGVNQDLHGIYNKLDKGLIQKQAVGRLLLQFRNWMRPGWNKRFGSKFGKSYFNERRNQLDKGTYVSFADFVFSPFKENAPYSYLDGEAVLNAFRAIARDYYKFITNAQVNWHSLDNGEKARVRKAAMEMFYLGATLIILGMLKGIKDDDDELKNMRSYNIMIYQLSRLQGELATYTPIWGWFNESQKFLSSPAASWSTAKNALKMFYYGAQIPFVPDNEARYKNGVYRGDYKAYIYFKKLVPGLTQYHKWYYINEMNRYYRLF